MKQKYSCLVPELIVLYEVPERKLRTDRDPDERTELLNRELRNPTEYRDPLPPLPPPPPLPPFIWT